MTTITIKELHASHPIAVIQPVQQGMGDRLDTSAPAKPENRFLTRKLLPGFAELQECLTGGTDSTDIISEMRDGR